MYYVHTGMQRGLHADTGLYVDTAKNGKKGRTLNSKWPLTATLAPPQSPVNFLGSLGQKWPHYTTFLRADIYTLTDCYLKIVQIDSKPPKALCKKSMVILAGAQK